MCFFIFASSAGAEPVQDVSVDVHSPNGQLIACITRTADGRLTYSLKKGAQPLLLPSKLGIVIDGEDLGQNVSLGKAVRQEIKETYPVLGAHAQALNWCQEAKIPITSLAGKTAWTLEVRVFDDGAAYRYHLPGVGTDKDKNKARTIGGETSQWCFPADSTIWYQDSSSRDYEKEFVTSTLKALPQNRTLMAGCTIKLPGDLGYLFPSEANLVNYSDMILQSDGTDASANSTTFKAIFPHDAKGWKQAGEIVSPWRVTLFAADLNTLVNSDILRNLCPAPSRELAGADWIVPGRANWHWMVSGKPKLPDQRKWVDWTRDLGWEYYLIDDGWIAWASEKQNPWEAMKEVVDYAATQKVKIWAWVDTKAVTEPAARIAYFEKAKQVGLVGLKIDFMGPPNAEWIKWYDDTLRDAAKVGLMINFHGCVKPTGRERTWPHELTREGVRGRENGKQNSAHDTALPFTRYVQGHADFTPTDWRSDKLKGGSWAHELAQAVVYTSPLLCYSGDPQNFLSNEAADILKAIPSTWDETIVLPGSAIGEVAAFARRKGDMWYLGIINGSKNRVLEIPLSFLGNGTWKSDQFADAGDRNDAWNRKTLPVTSKDVLRIEIRDNGGYVARFSH